MKFGRGHRGFRLSCTSILSISRITDSGTRLLARVYLFQVILLRVQRETPKKILFGLSDTQKVPAES